MPKHIIAQIRNDPFAKRDDEVVAQRARTREHGNHRDHHREVAVNESYALGAETEIDHAPYSKRHRERSGRCHDQRHERGERLSAIA